MHSLIRLLNDGGAVSLRYMKLWRSVVDSLTTCSLRGRISTDCYCSKLTVPKLPRFRLVSTWVQAFVDGMTERSIGSGSLDALATSLGTG